MNLRRRTALKAAGLAVTSLAGVGTASGASGPLPGDTTVDLGEKGLEPGDPIQPMIDEHLESGVNVVVPGDDDDPVRYEFNDDVVGEYEDAALVGDGMVELARGNGESRTITIDALAGEFRLGNVLSTGVQGVDDPKFRAFASDGGAITVHDVLQPDGSEPSHDSASGWYAPSEHSGTLTFRRCSVENFTDNGFYCSSPGDEGGGDGAVVLEGCYAHNNNVSGVRIGSSGSVVRDSVIVNDAIPETVGEDDSSALNGRAMRGLRIREPGDELRVENVHITHLADLGAPTEEANAAWRSDPFEIDDETGPGSCTVEALYIRNELPENRAIEVETQVGGEAYSLSGRNVHLTGDGDLSIGPAPADLRGVTRGCGAESPRTDPPTGNRSEDQ